MPMPKTKPRQVRRNFTMAAEDSDRIDEFASILALPGEEPNASMAIRIAIREAIERHQLAHRRTRKHVID